MTTAGWTGYTTQSNLIAQASLNALANGSWISGSVVDLSTPKPLYLDIDLVLSSAVSAGSGRPRVDIYLLPVLNGTNAPSPPASTTAAIPDCYFVGSIVAVASANFTRGALRGVILPGNGKFVVGLQNNLGVAFPPTNTSALNGYYYGEQAS